VLSNGITLIIPRLFPAEVLHTSQGEPSFSALTTNQKYLLCWYFTSWCVRTVRHSVWSAKSVSAKVIDDFCVTLICLFIYCFVAQVLKVCGAPGPTSCSKTKTLIKCV